MRNAILAISVFLLTLIPVAVAQSAYVTNEPGLSLEQVNLSTGKISVLYNIGARPDSLILNSLGQIIYSVPQLGVVELYDPSTGSNSILASGLTHPRDLVFDPSGTTLLIGLYSPGGIVRLNLITGTVTKLASNLGSVDGLAYDSVGDLFAVANHNTVVQIDPVSGKVLQTLVIEPHYKVNGGDGMVYDPYSGELWVSHDSTLGSGLIEIPTNLSTFTLFETGSIKVPDGIASDGKGNLFVGNGAQVIIYNIPSNAIVKTVKVPGIDSLALIPGTF